MADRDATRLRGQLVAQLERRRLIRSARVRQAFLTVPRELFVPELAERDGIEAVYRDEAIVTKSDERGLPLSSSSQPAIMALMLEQLDVEAGMRVLEIGTGTGYNAALLSMLVGRRGSVVSVDVDAPIAGAARRVLRIGGYRVRVVHADGRGGFPDAAPYDRIVVTASSDTVPRAWFDQLTDDGLLEAPLRLGDGGDTQVIPVLGKTPRGFRSLRTVCGGFMPLRGPGDGGGPARQPYLLVSDLTGARPKSVLQLSGPALATLPESAKHRLLATALGKPRRRRLGRRADHRALGLYLSLTLPKQKRVAAVPSFRVGAIGRDGRSLALLETRPERPEVGVVMSYGSDEAEELLFDHVLEWDRRGRPGEADLQITVAYEDDRPRLKAGWPPRSQHV